LQYVQSYPSTFSWALAFVAFGLLRERADRRDDLRYAALAVVLGVLVLTHVLTASWAIGVVLLYAADTSIRAQNAGPIARTALALGVAAAMGFAWPYSSPLGHRSMTGVQEGSVFGKSPFVDFPTLYALAVPCAAYLVWRFRRHQFWVLATVATLGALATWHVLDISFGNRYAFFAAFFAQFIVAEVMTLGIFALVGPLRELDEVRRWPWLDRPFVLVAFAVACLAWIPSPMIEQARKKGVLGSLPSPRELAERPSPHDAYYRQFATIAPYVFRGDVVLTPVARTVFDLASITGARVASSPNALQVPDQNLRASDVGRFFGESTEPEVRANIARHYRATKVLLPSHLFRLADSIAATFGAPLYRDDAYAVWKLDTSDSRGNP
jgi:hypothetical protein